jgi:hypothetical protein
MGINKCKYNLQPTDNFTRASRRGEEIIKAALSCFEASLGLRKLDAKSFLSLLTTL